MASQPAVLIDFYKTAENPLDTTTNQTRSKFDLLRGLAEDMRLFAQGVAHRVDRNQSTQTTELMESFSLPHVC